jgi:cell cycle sensor histidine kinase DivJ
MNAQLVADDSIAVLNHELRTSLNAILGFSDLLAGDGGLSQRHRRYAAHIHDSGRRLLIILEDLLDLARVMDQPTTESASRLVADSRLVASRDDG